MQPARVAIGVVSVIAALSAQTAFIPAKFIAGALPTQPVLAVGGGEVFVEVTVGENGAVEAVRPLRTTAGFTDPTIEAVRGWRFAPATDVDPATSQRRRVRSSVMVAAMFRPPALVNGTTGGEPPRDVAAASDAVPFPNEVPMPAFPSRALAGGVVLVEVSIDAAGRVTDANVIRSSPPFDEPSLDAARRASFRPARIQGRAAATVAYILFGYRQPITVKPGDYSDRSASSGATRVARRAGM